MVTVHRALDGSWAECSAAAPCELKFHFPDFTVEEAEGLPMRVLLPLLNEIDPPTFINPSGQLWWEDRFLRLHRDYDLPAWIAGEGDMEWWAEGHLHREGGKPAKTRPGREDRFYDHGARIEAPQVQS